MMTYEQLRAHWLYQCKGYWTGMSCASKRGFQQALADLRTARYSLGLL